MKKIETKKVLPGGCIEAKKYLNNKDMSSWRTRKPVHLPSKCIDCGQCWIICPDRAAVYKNGKFIKFDYKKCKGCGLCAKICPVQAILMETET